MSDSSVYSISTHVSEEYWMKGTHYVIDEVREIWLTFTHVQRRVLYRCFDEMASNEEWE